VTTLAASSRDSCRSHREQADGYVASDASYVAECVSKSVHCSTLLTFVTLTFAMSQPNAPNGDTA
jgi:hypothetical protein